MLYPKEDRIAHSLLYACRNCDFWAPADEPLVHRHELLTNAGETAGVTTDVGADPTLPRANKECARCHETDCVFFQSQQIARETKMTLFYVCTACGHITTS